MFKKFVANILMLWKKNVAIRRCFIYETIFVGSRLLWHTHYNKYLYIYKYKGIQPVCIYILVDVFIGRLGEKEYFRIDINLTCGVCNGSDNNAPIKFSKYDFMNVWVILLVLGPLWYIALWNYLYFLDYPSFFDVIRRRLVGSVERKSKTLWIVYLIAKSQENFQLEILCRIQ